MKIFRKRLKTSSWNRRFEQFSDHSTHEDPRSSGCSRREQDCIILAAVVLKAGMTSDWWKFSTASESVSCSFPTTTRACWRPDVMKMRSGSLHEAGDWRDESCGDGCGRRSFCGGVQPWKRLFERPIAITHANPSFGILHYETNRTGS